MAVEIELTDSEDAAATKAIVAGLRESVREFSSTIPGIESRDVLQLMLLTQHFGGRAALGCFWGWSKAWPLQN